MASVSAVSSFKFEDYLQLLVTQLQTQDPSEPVSNEQFFTQLTQSATLQGLQDLNASFDQMLRLSQLTDGANLIGKKVEFSGRNGAVSTGTVDRVTTDSGNKIVLQLTNGVQTGLDTVRSVLNA